MIPIFFINLHSKIIIDSISRQKHHRLTEDVPNRSKRMKTLGNAVSPPQVFPILKYIADIETGRCPMGGEEL